MLSRSVALRASAEASWPGGDRGSPATQHFRNCRVIANIYATLESFRTFIVSKDKFLESYQKEIIEPGLPTLQEP